uniref:GNAT family N-acetyltransferase n=1 Tax=Stappia sp. TaxID=1870903 RepID=UPI003BAD0516
MPNSRPEPVSACRSHIEGALALSREAGWPHTRDDWSFFLALSRGLAMLDGDDVVATTLVTPFGPVATVNMVLVARARRGRGLGRHILEKAMTLADPDEWRLVATPEGAPLYEKLGFRDAGRIVQHQGIVRPPATPRQDGKPDDARPVAAGLADLEDFAAADRMAGSHDRKDLLAACLRKGRALKLVRDSALSGFVITRPFGLGEVAGPLVARDLASARSLLAAVLDTSAGRFLRVDTDAGSGLGDMLEEHGLNPVGGGTRMVLNRHPLVTSRDFSTFALAAQAFG